MLWRLGTGVKLVVCKYMVGDRCGGLVWHLLHTQPQIPRLIATVVPGSWVKIYRVSTVAVLAIGFSVVKVSGFIWRAIHW